jgi:hypothetical protein
MEKGMTFFLLHDREGVQAHPASVNDAGPRPIQRTYELRLINEDGRTLSVLTLTHGSDDAAKQAIFEVREPYARYELWRGKEKINEGPRFVIAN